MRRLVLAGVLAGLLVLGAAWAWWRSRGAPTAPVIPGQDDRVVVEVVNGAGADGLARRVTRQLRADGIDVVYFGTAPYDTLSSTAIIQRRGDTLMAARVRKVLGVGQVRVDPDPRLLLDISVYLGRDLAAALGARP